MKQALWFIGVGCAAAAFCAFVLGQSTAMSLGFGACVVGFGYAHALGATVLDIVRGSSLWSAATLELVGLSLSIGAVWFAHNAGGTAEPPLLIAALVMSALGLGMGAFSVSGKQPAT